MASTEDRIRKLVQENLEVDGNPVELPQDLDSSLLEAGISSLDLVSFARVVAKEFDVTFTPEDCGNINTRSGTGRFPRRLSGLSASIRGVHCLDNRRLSSGPHGRSGSRRFHGGRAPAYGRVR